ncbi:MULTISPECIES: transporter substrate-binding domain-containing protein [Shouchella]|uniref:Transporter substrate-binding domain-containing protein n=2 Tax=Shouchella TaxID=2893057 RepID=A0ABY7WC09_9BACI|nr:MULTISPECIES: transporter substrate-binding domain-containing protein [Shouchella]MED4126956.1 transporter substrate-binding domain-containing protein [Shouchella miscanthi]WDF05337.1 transporter substrate-binding domain-containing protein [Shouchella hunanensis]GAF23873.1 glutamine ABC transporter, periplasmic glutamine-binding protein [Bacillus sp. JCM 19047]
MKKIVGTVTVAGAVLVLAACGSDETSSGETNSTANDENTEVVTYDIATDNNFVPFEFIDLETNELTGFDIELMEAIAEESGFEVNFHQMDFSGALSGIEQGSYDAAINGMSITEERKQNIDFSDPYYESGLVLAVAQDDDTIQSIDDLTSDHKVSTRLSSTSQTYLDEQTDAEVDAYPEITEAYQALIAGHVDAALYDMPNVQYFIQQQGEGSMKIVGDLLTGEDYGIAFPKGSDLVDDVNEALATLMENGTYGDIYETYFGERPEGM